jgi:DNA-binding MarR family transcriptional regulator
MKESSTISQVIENLISIHPLLSKSFTRAIRSKTNLTPGSLYVLGLLIRHGKLSMSEIGCRLAMQKPHVTLMVDKLITENLVERINDTADRRMVYIQVTKNGIQDFEYIKSTITEELRETLKQLDQDKLETLSTASGQVKDILMWLALEQQKSLHPSMCKRQEEDVPENIKQV